MFKKVDERIIDEQIFKKKTKKSQIRVKHQLKYSLQPRI